MKIRYFISALLAVLLLTISCGSHPSTDGEAGRCLSRLDSLVEADADSALRLLGRMQDNGWSRRDAMHMELLRAKAMNRADSLFTTDSLMLRVSQYYRRHGTRNERMLSLYLLGCTYRDMGSAPRAIETWQQAVAEADTNRQDCDLSTLMRIHSQMNELYTRQRLPEYAQSEAELAEAICWKMGDTLNALIFEEKKCGLLYSKGQYEECIQATDRVYHLYLQNGYRNMGALSCVYCIKSYLALGDYAKAGEYLTIYESYCLAETDHRKIDGGLAPYYIYKGNYYLGVGNTDSAEHCFRRAMPGMMPLDNDVAVYYGLQRVFSSRNQTDSVLKYSKLYGQAKERSFAAAIAQSTIDAKSLYDYSVEQKIAWQEKEKKTQAENRLYRTYWIISAIVASFLALLYILYLKWYLRKKERDEELMTLELDMREIQLENQQKEHAIQQQLMHLHEEEEKNKAAKERIEALHQHVQEIETEKDKCLSNIASLEEELKRQEAAFKMAQSSVYDAVEQESNLRRLYDEEKARADRLAASEREAQEQIEQLKQEAIERNLRIERLDELTRNYWNEEIASSEIVEKFVSRVNNNPASITNDDWKRLRATVEIRYPGFYKAMNMRNHLEPDEYRACLLTIAERFRPSDLESLLGWTYDSASKKRQYLLKKIFGVSGGAAKFDEMVRESVQPKEI